MAGVHFSESDAAKNFQGLLSHLRAGEDVLIDSHGHPPTLIRAATPRMRTITQCIAIARQREEETGEIPVLDADCAADVEEIIRDRKPSNAPDWD